MQPALRTIVGADMAALRLYGPMGDGQPQADAVGFLLTTATEKRLENSRQIVFGDTGP